MKRLFLVTFFIIHNLFAQSEAGAIFLLISPSPTMNGLGEIGVCLPSSDIYSAHFNPANGINGMNGISFAHSGMETQWLPNLASDLIISYEVFSLGLIQSEKPYQVVLSNHKMLMDLGYMYDECGRVSTSNLKSNALTLGMKYKITFFKQPFDISLGVTRKKGVQDFGWFSPSDYFTSKNILYDYGFLFSIPYTTSLFSFFNNDIGLIINPALGYSISNVGGDIKFIDKNSSDPSPRYARCGISSSMSLNINSYWKLVEWRGGRSVSDMLLKFKITDDTQKHSYQIGLGDIDLWDNIVRSNPDSSLTIHRGNEWTFFDIYSIRKGRRIDPSGKINLKTKGYSYQLKGIMDLLFILTKDPVYRNISEYFDVRYNYSKYIEEKGHPLDRIEFESFVFTIKNIDKILRNIL